MLREKITKMVGDYDVEPGRTETYEEFSDRLITAVLDNLDREAMVVAVEEELCRPGGKHRPTRDVSADIIDAALAAVRPLGNGG